MRKLTLWLIIPCLIATLAMAASTPSPTRNLGKAIDVQRRLALERPDDAVVLNDLGNLLRMGGKLEEAEDAYRKAIAAAPQKVSAHYNLGLLLQQVGKGDKALKEFREVVELDPQFAWAHFQIGTVLEAKGNDSQALRSYARAFSINPELAFFEVNPQIIETRLLTEALLTSYRETASRPQAPNTYADPSHVTSLLLAAPSAATREEAAANATAPATGERPPASSLNQSSLSPAPMTKRTGSRPATEEADAPRVLTVNELDGRQVGQIGPAGGGAPQRGGSRPRQGGYGGTRASSVNSGGGYTWSKGATSTPGGSRGTQARPGAGSRPTIVQPSYVAPGVPAASPQTKPNDGSGGFGTGGFRPGQNSTGSLENGLVRETAWG